MYIVERHDFCLVTVGPPVSLSPSTPSPGAVLPLFVLWLFQGNLRPEEALQALTIYEGKFGRLKDDREKCAKAKEALELTDTGLLSGSEERVQVGNCSTRLFHCPGHPKDPDTCQGGFPFCC